MTGSDLMLAYAAYGRLVEIAYRPLNPTNVYCVMLLIQCLARLLGGIFSCMITYSNDGFQWFLGLRDLLLIFEVAIFYQLFSGAFPAENK
jgi:hypothetical protein